MFLKTASIRRIKAAQEVGAQQVMELIPAHLSTPISSRMVLSALTA